MGSLRLKFLFAMCGLLIVCLSAYLFMAIAVFKSDKTQLVFDLNRSQVSNLTAEIETELNGVSDKLKVFAQLPADLQTRMAEDLFSDESEIVAVSVLDTQSHRSLRSFAQKQFLETYGLDKSHFDQIAEGGAVPFDDILKHAQSVWNASVENGPPMMGYGRLVVLQDKDGVPVQQWAVIGFVKLDRLMKAVSLIHLSQVYVANANGEILVQRDGKALLRKPKVAGDDIFKEALNSKVKTSLIDRKSSTGRVLAAFSKGFDDQIFVVAHADESEVFQVVQDFTIRTFLFGAIVLTLVTLAAFWLSRSLTENIGLLVDRMASVSTGDLTSPIHLKSRDETAMLAKTFNKMIVDLRESRDQLEEMNRELDQKVNDRTAQLEEQNRKVKEIQETLIRTTKLASVGEIAGRTAHEVLNPLTILLTRLGIMQKRVAKSQDESLGLLDDIHKGWAGDYQDGGFDGLIKKWSEASEVEDHKTLFQEDLGNVEKISSELRDQTESIHRDILFVRDQGERIGKIVNAMRNLGQAKSELQSQSVHALLSDCCQIMGDLFEQRSIAVVQTYAASNDICRIDRDEMIQAVTNLMRNSLQALEACAHSGKLHSLNLIIRTRNERDFLMIEIEDNGVGISGEHQQQLFENSFTTKPPEQGTGLGLGISRRFIRGNGGEIDFISSQPFQRTVFRIQLPLSETQTRGAVA
jgi:signal transduction histidine kinase